MRFHRIPSKATEHLMLVVAEQTATDETEINLTHLFHLYPKPNPAAIAGSWKQKGQDSLFCVLDVALKRQAKWVPGPTI